MRKRLRPIDLRSPTVTLPRCGPALLARSALLSFGLVLAGCDGCSGPQASSQDPTDVEVSLEGLPRGCAPSALTTRETPGFVAEPNVAEPAWRLEAVGSVTSARLVGAGLVRTVVLSTAGSFSSQVEQTFHDGEGQILLFLSSGSGEVAVGAYPLREGPQPTGFVTLNYGSGRYMNVSTEPDFHPRGEIVVERIIDGVACGRFDVQNDKAHFAGTFAAKM